jgi:hypothetical protein
VVKEVNDKEGKGNWDQGVGGREEGNDKEGKVNWDQGVGGREEGSDKEGKGNWDQGDGGRQKGTIKRAKRTGTRAMENDNRKRFPVAFKRNVLLRFRCCC